MKSLFCAVVAAIGFGIAGCDRLDDKKPVTPIDPQNGGEAVESAPAAPEESAPEESAPAAPEESAPAPPEESEVQTP